MWFYGVYEIRKRYDVWIYIVQAKIEVPNEIIHL